MASKGYYLRSRDVAHILDITPDEVSQLAQKGQLKGTKEGRFWRFRFREVMTYKKLQEEEEIALRLSPFSSRRLSSNSWSR